MAALSSNTIINALAFKNRLKEVVNNLLPTSGYYSNTNSPYEKLTPLLTTREDLYSDICSIIDNSNSTRYYNTTPVTINLEAGTYDFVLRGGGGAGGETARGGAGGKGDLITQQLIFDTDKTITICVGMGGLTYANGGNGGPGGQSVVTGGAGGGGGYPTYIIVDGTYYYAQGGGGGGGGGANANYGRYSVAGSGGGGGGYYTFNNGTLTSIPGQIGGNNGGNNDGNGSAGTDGNMAFSSLVAGTGGRGGYSEGWRTYGGAGGTGAGAGGGGGGAGAGNHSSSSGGGGGGGTGGDLDAGGGFGGSGKQYGIDATNAKSTPTDVTIENRIYGIEYKYGSGGLPDDNGENGFIIITKIG